MNDRFDRQLPPPEKKDLPLLLAKNPEQYDFLKKFEHLEDSPYAFHRQILILGLIAFVHGAHHVSGGWEAVPEWNGTFFARYNSEEVRKHGYEIMVRDNQKSVGAILDPHIGETEEKIVTAEPGSIEVLILDRPPGHETEFAFGFKVLVLQTGQIRILQTYPEIWEEYMGEVPFPFDAEESAIGGLLLINYDINPEEVDPQILEFIQNVLAKTIKDIRKKL